MDDVDIIKTNITNMEDQERAFYIADIGNVLRKHQEWMLLFVYFILN